ncbi:MAG: hypothetical protein WAL94_05625 [Bacteroidales bacterium]
MRALQSKYLLTVILVLSRFGLSTSASPEINLNTPADTLISIRQHPLLQGYESAVIITDRNTYIAGEEVWYTMLLQRSGGKADQQSKAGYAEILNCYNTPVSQSRILIDENGTGTGLLSLPDSISSGDYILRGYTRSMAYLGPDHFFTTLIRVFNPYVRDTDYDRISLAGTPAGPSLALYPEGGAMVPGAVNKVAVRTTGQGGKGVPVKVFFTDQEGTVADSVTTDSTGLALVNIIPSKTATLVAIAQIETAEVRAEIPPYSRSDYSLVFSGDGSRTGRIIVKTPGSAAGQLYLSIISPGRISLYRELDRVQKETPVEISFSDLGPGINEALLYDNRGNLLSSRLFMNTYESMNSVMKNDISYIIRNDSLVVRLPRNISSASVSVTVSEDHAGIDLQSYSCLSVWLTSATLNNPFMQPFLSGAAEISDDLLITLNDRHLHSRHEEIPLTAGETHGLAVSGVVTDLDNLHPAGGKFLFINLPGKDCFLQYTRTDTAGRFNFIIPPRKGLAEVVVYPRDTADNIVIKTSTSFSDDFIPLQCSLADISDEADRSALRMSINSQVMRIYNNSRRDTLGFPEADGSTGHFYGKASYRLLLSDFIALPNMEEVFFELVPNMDLVNSRRGYFFRMFDPVTGNELKITPMLFIDGTYTTDPGTIAELPPEKTEYIDIIFVPYRLGEVLLPPVISVVTRQGDYRLQALPEAAMRISYLFSDPEIKFKAFPGDMSGRSPVLNNTMLWAPLLNPESDREYSFRLPDPDYPDALRMNISVSGPGQYPFNITELIDINRPE